VPTLLLIRHAQASYGGPNYDVVSDLGRRQLAVLSRSLHRRGIEPARIITGSLRRQRETARACAGEAGAQDAVDTRWNEYDDDDVLTHHSATGQRLDGSVTISSRDFQVIIDAALERWIAAGDEGDGETWPRFRARVIEALSDAVRDLGRGETALAVSSSGVIAALAASLLGLPDQAFLDLNRVSVNAGITKVIIGSRGITLVSYNEHGHLEEADAGLVTYR
jgi:broad specificity phosphatase PhoE